MQRIISGIVLVGVVIPSFLGFFVTTAQAQSPQPPVDCVLNPLDPSCLNSGTPDSTLPNTLSCNYIKDNRGIKTQSDLDDEITRTNKASEFIDKNLPVLEEALDSLKKAKSIPPKTEFQGGGPYGGGAVVDLNAPKVAQLRDEALAKVKAFETAYGADLVNEEALYSANGQGLPLINAGFFNTLYRLFGGKNWDEMEKEINNVILQLKERQKQFNQEKFIAQICKEQSSSNPNLNTIANLQSQLDQAKLDELGLLNQERTELEAQGDRFREELASYSKCDVWSKDGLAVCVRDLIGLIFKILTSLATWILYGVSYFFNYVIKFSIVDFKGLIDGDTSGAGGLAVMTLWKTVRDIANMFAIFLLLYIAMGTILQINKIDTPKAMTTLIVVALLINFSGVFTRIAIDGSNVVSLLFYSRFSINGEEPNIAGAFTQAARINNIMTAEIKQSDNEEDTITSTIAKGLGVLIVMLTTTFVLLMSAGFFIVRCVALILLIITSPLAMMGTAVPWLYDNVTKKWKDEFISQITFAPIFMALLYFTLSIAQKAPSVKFTGTSNQLMGNVLIYAILTIMMFACLTIARNSAKGVASSKIKGIGLAGAALAGAGVGAFGSRFGGGAAQRYLDSGRGNKVTRAFANQLATRTWNPMNAIKATDKKISDLASGKGGDFNNRSYTQIQKDREKASKDKVENHKFNMKTMANDQVRANYINGIKNADERKELYKSLSAQDRAKYELAAAGTAAEATLRTLRTEFNNDDDEGRNKNNKARAEEHKKRMRALTTDADKAAYIARVADTDERKELYKEIDVGDRGRYEAAATGTVVLTPGAAPTSIKGVLRNLRDGLKDEDQEKTDKAESRARRNIETDGAKKLLTRLLIDTPAGPARAALLSMQTPPLDTIKGIVEAIGPNDIAKISRDKTVMDAILSNPGVSSNFTPAYLAKIKIAWSENDSISRQTVDDISDRLFRPLSGLTTLTPQQKAIKDWYETNPDMQH